MEWANKNCTPEQADLFFVEKGQDSRPAQAICSACEIQVECLQYALDNHERFAIWGGVSERQRRRIRHMGVTATEYFDGIEDGTILAPRRGRPVKEEV